MNIDLKTATLVLAVFSAVVNTVLFVLLAPKWWQQRHLHRRRKEAERARQRDAKFARQRQAEIDAKREARDALDEQYERELEARRLEPAEAAGHQASQAERDRDDRAK